RIRTEAQLISDKGKASHWLGVLSCVLALACAPGMAEPELAGVSRIELKVSKLDTSMHFYGQLFGAAAWQLAPDGRAWLPLGNAWLVLSEREPAGIERSVFAVTNFDASSLQTYLATQRLRPVRDSEALLSVRDGDGIASALADRDAALEVPVPATAHEGREDAIFLP